MTKNHDHTVAARMRAMRARRKAAGLVSLSATVTPEVRDLCIQITRADAETIAKIRAALK